MTHRVLQRRSIDSCNIPLVKREVQAQAPFVPTNRNAAAHQSTIEERFGEYGQDMLLNAAGPGALSPDGTYFMEWQGELKVVDAMVSAGLLTRKGDEVTITDAGRAAAWTAGLQAA